MATTEEFTRLVRGLLQAQRHYPESDASEEILTPQTSTEVREVQEDESPTPTFIQRFIPQVVTSTLSQGGSLLREFVCMLLGNIGGFLRSLRIANDRPAEAQALLFPRGDLPYRRYWWDSDDENDSVGEYYSHRHYA